MLKERIRVLEAENESLKLGCAAPGTPGPSEAMQVDGEDVELQIQLYKASNAIVQG